MASLGSAGRTSHLRASQPASRAAVATGSSRRVGRPARSLMLTDLQRVPSSPLSPPHAALLFHLWKSIPFSFKDGACPKAAVVVQECSYYYC